MTSASSSPQPGRRAFAFDAETLGEGLAGALGRAVFGRAEFRQTVEVAAALTDHAVEQAPGQRRGLEHVDAPCSGRLP